METRFHDRALRVRGTADTRIRGHGVATGRNIPACTRRGTPYYSSLSPLSRDTTVRSPTTRPDAGTSCKDEQRRAASRQLILRARLKGTPPSRESPDCTPARRSFHFYYSLPSRIIRAGNCSNFFPRTSGIFYRRAFARREMSAPRLGTLGGELFRKERNRRPGEDFAPAAGTLISRGFLEFVYAERGICINVRSLIVTR